MTEEGYVQTQGNNLSTVHLTPELRSWIEDELSRGLVQQFVTDAKDNHLSYRKVIALISELWGEE